MNQNYIILQQTVLQKRHNKKRGSAVKNNKSSPRQPTSKMVNEERQKMVIYKANVVKEDINQLLMYLGANHDVSAIVQKMDQLNRDIADLDNYFYNCYRKRPTRVKPGQVPASHSVVH